MNLHTTQPQPQQFTFFNTFTTQPQQFTFFNTFDEPKDEPKSPSPKDEPPKDEPSKTISQEDHERALQTEKENAKKLMQEISLLKTRKEMTAEERTAQDKRLQELENKLLTAEELASREQSKLQKQLEQREAELSSDRDRWATLYKEERIVRSILDASHQHEAINPEQMVALLRSKTELVEIKNEDGEVTGFEVQMQVNDKDKHGKPFTAKFDVAKALEHMKTQPENFNLFKTSLKRGFNTSSSAGGNSQTLEEIAKDPTKWAEYSRAQRKKGI